MDIRASFWGLCCIVRRDLAQPAEVFLPTGRDETCHHAGEHEHMGHAATIMIPTDQVDGATDWLPTGVIQVGPKKQLAYWLVKDGDVIEFAKTGGCPQWKNDDKSIQFRKYHKNPVRSRLELTGVGYPVIVVAGGFLDGDEELKPKIKKPGTSGKSEEDLRRTVVWTRTTLQFEVSSKVNGGAIRFKGNGVEITVTNVGRKPGKGRDHFDMYYCLLEGNQSITDRIIYNPDNERIEESRGVDVYDCVPPTGGS